MTQAGGSWQVPAGSRTPGLAAERRGVTVVLPISNLARATGVTVVLPTHRSLAGRTPGTPAMAHAATSVRCGCESDRRLSSGPMPRPCLARFAGAPARQRPVRLVAGLTPSACRVHRIHLWLLCGARLSILSECPGGALPVHPGHGPICIGTCDLATVPRAEAATCASRSVPSSAGVCIPDVSTTPAARLHDCFHDRSPWSVRDSGSKVAIPVVAVIAHRTAVRFRNRFRLPHGYCVTASAPPAPTVPRAPRARATIPMVCAPCAAPATPTVARAIIVPGGPRWRERVIPTAPATVSARTCLYIGTGSAESCLLHPIRRIDSRRRQARFPSSALTSAAVSALVWQLRVDGGQFLRGRVAIDVGGARPITSTEILSLSRCAPLAALVATARKAGLPCPVEEHQA